VNEPSEAMFNITCILYVAEN